MMDDLSCYTVVVSDYHVLPKHPSHSGLDTQCLDFEALSPCVKQGMLMSTVTRDLVRMQALDTGLQRFDS